MVYGLQQAARCRSLPDRICDALVDGKLVADATSKPVLESNTLTVIVVQQKIYETLDVECENLQTREFIDLDKVSLGYRFPTSVKPGTYRVTVTGFNPGIARKRLDVQVGDTPKPPDPPGPNPPGPTPTPDVVPNEYGVGAVAFQFAPKVASEAKSLAAMYRQAGEFLYGRPSLKFITSDSDKDAKNPDRSVIAWLAQQQASTTLADRAAWTTWKLKLREAFTASQNARQYTREDWYNAFNEVATALEAVK